MFDSGEKIDFSVIIITPWCILAFTVSSFKLNESFTKSHGDIMYRRATVFKYQLGTTCAYNTVTTKGSSGPLLLGFLSAPNVWFFLAVSLLQKKRGRGRIFYGMHLGKTSWLVFLDSLVPCLLQTLLAQHSDLVCSCICKAIIPFPHWICSMMTGEKAAVPMVGDAKPWWCSAYHPAGLTWGNCSQLQIALAKSEGT